MIGNFDKPSAANSFRVDFGSLNLSSCSFAKCQLEHTDTENENVGERFLLEAIKQHQNQLVIVQKNKKNLEKDIISLRDIGQNECSRRKSTSTILITDLLEGDSKDMGLNKTNKGHGHESECNELLEEVKKVLTIRIAELETELKETRRQLHNIKAKHSAAKLLALSIVNVDLELSDRIDTQTSGSISIPRALLMIHKSIKEMKNIIKIQKEQNSDLLIKLREKEKQLLDNRSQIDRVGNNQIQVEKDLDGLKEELEDFWSDLSERLDQLIQLTE